MLRRVLKLVAFCDYCKKQSKPFEVISYGHSSKNEPEPHEFMKDLPFGWGTLTSGGWGMTNYTRTQVLCMDCLDKAEAKKEGQIERSKKGPLDGLAEV